MENFDYELTLIVRQRPITYMPIMEEAIKVSVRSLPRSHTQESIRFLLV
jgi:hypothetical protein